MEEEIVRVTPQQLKEYREHLMQLYTKLDEALELARKEAASCGNTGRRKEPTVTIQVINPGVIDEDARAVHKAVLAAVKRRKRMREGDGEK